MKNQFLHRALITILTAGSCVTWATAEPDDLNRCNVVWDSPSADCHGSMPIGNGDLAANVWVEPNGDLLFYLSKSDSWSGEQELLKLGRIRVKMDPALVADGAVFKQELDLETGTIRINSQLGTRNSQLSFWIDANQDVVNVEIEGSEVFSAQVMLEPWRVPGKKLYGGAVADAVLPAEGTTIRWFQRNSKSIFEGTLKNQHLGGVIDNYQDPLMNRTFGGLIVGEGLQSQDSKTLKTAAPLKKLHLRVHALTAQTDTEDEWVAQLEKQRAQADAVPLETSRAAHEAYWSDFWSRSHIFITGTEAAKRVTSAYTLQRWIQACAGRGAFPIKFNGSLFTVDGVDLNRRTKVEEEYGPDYRKWGGCYWFQNTREPYWAMLYSGDTDQMAPLFEMYRKALPLLKDRTQTYFNHDGIFCSETIYFWGLNREHDFGAGNLDMYPKNAYVRYYWDSGNELSMMMLDYYAHTGDDRFARNTLIPIADEVVTFYDLHHQRTPEGKVLFSPSMSLETWHTAEDPLPVVVGLKTVLTRLLELPDSLTSEEQRTRWTRFRSELPEIPFGEEDGKQWIKPARTYSDCKNSENPELYAVFPYRAYGVGKPDLDVALETWERRRIKQTGGWRQDAIQAAMLGLTDEARRDVTKNATRQCLIREPVYQARFPAFWGPNFDWTPDQCQGSVTMIALQRMLMQCDGREIRLLPAWPKEWTASFKLHAPYHTTVEGRVKNGKVIDLKVTPESRRNDIVQ
ncbi:MAG: DUF5703 domain-containing protein [Opitutae bacterium]|nr:DUF5703 domain-containing protein [Opitutae bacterium]MDG1300900.1 DUF5703 domain-containing protein [Opitutae bacterium]